MGINEKAVKVHRGRIMEKLCADSVADLALLAEKAGIELPDKEVH
jgi:DNA-binding NarL/FixJ family response regulator